MKEHDQETEIKRLADAPGESLIAEFRLAIEELRSHIAEMQGHLGEVNADPAVAASTDIGDATQ